MNLRGLRGWGAAVAVAPPLFFFVVSNGPPGIYDEGFVVAGAAEILRGGMPYRDFWTHYAPGQFYVVAGLFHLIAPSLFVERLWDTLVRSAIVWTVYRLAGHLLPRPGATAAAVVVMLRLGAAGFPAYPSLPAMLFALLAVERLAGAAERPGEGRLLAAGTATGLAALFRQDTGVSAFLGAMLALAAWPQGPGAARVFLRRAALFTGGVALPTVPVALYLVSRAGLSDPLWQMVGFPWHVMVPATRLPFPAPWPPLGALFSGLAWRMGHVERDWVRWADLYLPVIAYALTAARVGWSLYARGETMIPRRHRGTLLMLVWLGVAYILQATNRFDPIHALPAVVVAVILLTYGLWAPFALERPLARWGTVALAAPVLAFLWIGIPLTIWWSGVKAWGPPVCATPLARQGCVTLNPDQARAIRLVRLRTEPNEPIFVGLTRHDRILMNDAIFYFLADRPAATRYVALQPGIATDASGQEEIVRRLGAQDLRYAVLYDLGDDVLNRHTPDTPPGSTILDRFLREAFEPAGRFGPYTVWRKRPS
jgi:hypothetical protein